MSGKFQLHVSGLSMLSKCGEQFRRRYVEGERIPPGVAVLIGSATDKAVTANLQNKMDHGELLPEEAVKAAARDCFVAAWDQGVTLDDDWGELGYKKAKAEGIDKSVTLAGLHWSEAAPFIKPTHVQREWVLDVDGLDELQLAGTIDIQEGLDAIRDTKTKKKAPFADEAHQSIQLTSYALAVSAHDGAPPKRVVLDFLVHTKKPQLVQLESKRTVSDFPHFLDRIAAAANVMKSGAFMPAPLDSWWCNPKYCGYHPTCRYARKPVSVAVGAKE